MSAVNIYITVIELALLRALSSNLRLKIERSDVCLADVMAPIIKTTSVVVLIPPAVEPGLPPIIINIIVKKLPLSESPDILTVLNPAVLGVTDWNNEAKIFHIYSNWLM